MNIENKNSILVIDDEKANIIKLTHILSPEYTIYAAKNGQNGIKAAKNNLPDIILLDILMPEMDGYEVIEILKSTEETKEIPVIFVTGLTDSKDEEKGFNLGAADYILKPFSTSTVKLRVKNQINIINQTRLKIEKEAAEQSNKSKTEFLSRMSHEMLTPMNTIIGMMQVVRMTEHPKNIGEIYDEIDAASHRLLELIYDMLDIYDVEKNMFTLGNSEFSFAEMLNNTLKTVTPYMEEKNQIFSYEADTSILDVLIGDEYRLAQVIRNLLTNSSKFTPEGGEIRLKISVIGEEQGLLTLQTEITDNGIGISEKQKNAILRIFEQADGSTTRRFGGAGLGLPISKYIVEKMGGEIWFESEPGKGTKFVFTVKVKILNKDENIV